jgi:2-polyprenyl-3-methyl-5-hydroxy-6-metoxy-1,4-benzoquinol methylase
MSTEIIGQEHFQVRHDVIRMVPRPLGRILDIGCGPGLTGAALMNLGAAEVWGIERDAALAEEARSRVTRVEQIDLEKDPTEGLPLGFFNAILYADVLEHLVDPWRVLAQQRELLAPGGSILLSIPNVRNLRVMLPLIVQGRWDYVDEGLLSRGHLRFFTTRSMRSMIEGAGYRIVEQEGTYAPKGWWLRRISVGALDDLVARQRIFRAVTA